MRRFLFPGLVICLAILSGCTNADSAKFYELRGKVVSANAAQKTVRIAHEEIPGFMKAMEMNFSVDDLKLLDGLAPGDLVAGKLRVSGSNYTLTELHKVEAAAVEAPVKDKDEAAEVKSNLAKLGPEDEKLAAAQRYCAVENNNLLGSMGVPLKMMVRDQPVFICCKGCQRTVEKKPEEALKKVAELKANGAEK